MPSFGRLGFLEHSCVSSSSAGSGGDSVIAMEPSRHLLLFGINFDPEKTGIGPYTTGMAEHLARRGHKVTVVTGMPHYPEWRIDPAYRRRFRVQEWRNDVLVRRVRHYVPSRQSAPGRGVYELTFLLQSLTLVGLPRPDCAIGVVPSLGGGVAAAVYGRRFGVPFGLVFQDLVAQAASQSGIPGGGLAAGPALAIEARLARRSNRIAVVAKAFERRLVDLQVAPDKIVHVPNWTHVRRPGGHRASVRARLGWQPGHRIALHAGNMGFKQDLENVVAAASLAWQRDLDIRFVLMGDGNDRDRLEGLAAGLRNVSFLDPQPDDVFVDILNAADVLLLNERRSVMDMSLPSKITSYFAAGRPVVAAVPSGGTTSEELDRSGGAFVVEAGDPMALLSAVDHVSSSRALGEELVERAARYARNHLAADVLLRRVEQFVDALLADGSPGPGAGGEHSRRTEQSPLQ